MLPTWTGREFLLGRCIRKFYRGHTCTDERAVCVLITGSYVEDFSSGCAKVGIPHLGIMTLVDWVFIFRKRFATIYIFEGSRLFGYHCTIQNGSAADQNNLQEGCPDSAPGATVSVYAVAPGQW